MTVGQNVNWSRGVKSFLSPPWGKFIKSVEEECQVVKRGREYHGCGEEYNVEKRERGSKIIVPMILKLLGRISRGKVTEILGKKIKIIKNGGGEEYQVVGNFIHPKRNLNWP